MYKVKITTSKNTDFHLRQTPNGKGISKCGKYQFFINQNIKDPDFWVVRNKNLKSKTTCFIAPENTLLMTSEPYSIVNYPKRYRDQFGLICTSQTHVKHKNVHYTQAILPWYVGYKQNNGSYYVTKTYDNIKNSPFPQKTKLISVITSNKSITKGHLQRINFVEKLKKHYGDKIDVFGRGFNEFNDKWDVLAPYKYHIAIENSSSIHYWTEKISDCFLTGTFPIYYGCPNIGDYFPESSFKTIDINNFDEAIQKIDAIIANNEYERNRESLVRSRELVLEDYNMFNIIARYCDKLNPQSPKKMVTLKPSVTILDLHNIYTYFIRRNYYSLKFFIKNLLRNQGLNSNQSS